MPRPAQSPLEKAQRAYNKLADAPTPIGRTALMNALDRVETTGQGMMREQGLGIIAFAQTMIAANSRALALNAAGSIQPPLDAEQTATLTARNETFQIFIDNDPGSGTPPTPTDPAAIPTTGRKG